jgi:hypothetical protein
MYIHVFVRVSIRVYRGERRSRGQRDEIEVGMTETETETETCGERKRRKEDILENSHCHHF